MKKGIENAKQPGALFTFPVGNKIEEIPDAL